MQLDFVNRELTIKLVYYGPALSGKTTNLQALHKCAAPGASGRLMTLETRDDRTLFFDLLPLTFKSQGSLAVRLKVFTVPGQVIHASTRRLVVQGADGIAFIADSRVVETQHNADSFLDLKHNLKEHGLVLKKMPLIIQFNKRDLPDVRKDDEIAQLAAQGREPVYMAVATRGVGVVESFLGLLHLTWSALDFEHELSKKWGFDAYAFLGQVAEKLGDKRPLREILRQNVGGSIDARPEAATAADKDTKQGAGR
ncbi:MAG TPA: gliding motility protein [Polyangiaceae bacterium]|nr:gliding motility protein [Polyangiaceae bacterium]